MNYTLPSISVWEIAVLSALTLMTDNSVPLCLSLMPFTVLPQGWNSERVSLNKFVHGPFKRNSLALQEHPVSLCHNLHRVLQPEIMGTSLLSTGTLV